MARGPTQNPAHHIAWRSERVFRDARRNRTKPADRRRECRCSAATSIKGSLHRRNHQRRATARAVAHRTYLPRRRSAAIGSPDRQEHPSAIATLPRRCINRASFDQPRLASFTTHTKHEGRSLPVNTGTSVAFAARTRPGSMLMMRDASGKSHCRPSSRHSSSNE